MFGKRNKPSQSHQDDFAPADFSEDFGDTFESADQDLHDDAAAWGEPQDTVQQQTQAAASPKKAASGFGKLLPVLAVAGLGAVGAGYFFFLPQGNTTQPVVAEVAQEASPLLALPPSDVADGTQGQVVSPSTPPTETAALASSPSSAEAMPSDAVPIVVDVPSDTVAPSSEPPVTPMATDTDMAVSPSVDETPLASASEPTTAFEPVTSTAPAPLPTAVPAPAATPVAPIMAQKPQTSPVAPVIAVTPEPLVAQTPLTVAPESSPTISSSVAQRSNPAADASADVSALSARLMVLERQIDDLAKAVDKMAAMTPPSDAVARLSKTVDALSKQVVALKSAPASASVVVSSRPLVAPSAPAAKDLAAESTSLAPVLSATAASPVVSQPAQRVESQAKAPVAAKPVAWVLRAAQSGMAWVSPSKDGDLQRVAVGETLAGVGRIRSIEIKDGAWEITGTKGKIRQ